MKSWTTIAGCGVVAMSVFLASCGGEKNVANVKKPVGTPAAAKAPNVAPVAKDTPAAKPAVAAVKQAPFSAEMSAEFMRMVMETSARIEGVKTRIAEREAVIFETNPEVKAYRTQLVEMQSEISKIMEADTELAALKLNRDILWTTMPTRPQGNAKGGPARGFGPIR